MGLNAVEYYELEHCPVCLREDAGWRQVRVGFLRPALQLVINRDSTIWRACKCGVYFQHPMPTTDSLARFYEKDYGVFWPGHGSKKRAAMVVEIIQECDEGTILDIGCAAGLFLAEAKEKGWTASGVEPGFENRALAKAHGTVYANIDDVPDTYSWIVLCHVLEHTSDPVAALAACKKLLAEDSKMLVVTPTPTCLGGVNLTASHTILFSPEALVIAVERAGFTVIEVIEKKNETAIIANLEKRKEL